ncbi:hypothetical protein AYO44_00180 [Planctomycetaceae bacterium SCGC AG-212-F19]|nr:hypothetical protein AYO44_00180 [Planctomycetaceae bacterium SCGC AG-212-F19]
MDIDLLTHIPLFAKLTREELAGLASLLNRKDVPTNQVIFWIGDQGSDFYIVQVGRVQIVEPDEQGKEIILATSGAGSFFGELSLLDGGPRTATVRTMAECIFLTLNRHDFLTFLERHPVAAIHVLTVLGQRQRETLLMVRGMKNVNQVIEERQTLGQHFADWFAVWMGSWTFIIVQTILFVIWMIVNVILVESNGQWDPYPFILLNLVLAFLSCYAAPIIMMSQNRQSDKDRIKAELDYQVNVKAHHEVMQLHRKLDLLASMVENMQVPAVPRSEIHDTEPPPSD